MNAILIDDEKPALQQLERLLKKDGRIQIAGKYTSARKGLEHLREDKTDLVFLDIGMPEMNGLEAAEHIQAIHPGIRIIYITAYANYAVEAFELHALDYLLKPINPERFQKTLERIEQSMQALPKLEPEQAAAHSVAASISCFKRLELYPAGDAKTRLKWRTYKAQEMFAYLLHHNERWVLKDQIVDSVWQEYEQDKAVTYLHTTVYHIRKLLKEWGVQAKVEFSQERYRLLKSNLQTDVEQFEGLIETSQIRDDAQAGRCEQAVALYRGEYLEEHDYGWASAKRKQLHQQYITTNLRLSEYDLGKGEDSQSLGRLLQLQEKEPYSEEICKMILKGYVKASNHGQARAHYQGYETLLREELGIEPEHEFKQWARSLLSG